MAEQEQQNPTPETPVDAPAPEQPAAEAAPEPDLAARVAELEAQLKDQALRAQAELQNMQRRAERDVAHAHKFGLEKLASAMIDVVDNLERALDSTPAEQEASKALREGVALTHKHLLDTLKRFAVEQVNPVGEPFNPELHQAVSMQPSTTAEPNSVSAVLAKGYTLSGRLLRPARVVVATAG